MARRSLKPQLNQIRAWVRQGRTDAWIAHQLEVSASELREFRSQHDLNAEEDTGSGEIDLRDEIEAEIEAAAAEEEEEVEEEDFDEEESEEEVEEDAPRERPRHRPREGAGREPRERESAGRDGESGGDGRPRRRRRRGRRGGRGRRRPEYEAAFDHGERDGYGLWLDPSVKDNPVYAQHWAGKREVTVRIDPDQIVIRRPGVPAPESDQ
ncbi:MAG TPA: hypothetical protein VNM89_06660 [Solirubrobacterales bacterium]|nr:hypothetical protein [Solirubrobacterales bacterium]